MLFLNLPTAKILSLKKPRFDGIFIIKHSHPDGLKKTDLGGKKQEWEPCFEVVICRLVR